MGGDSPEEDLETTRVSHVNEVDEGLSSRAQRERACLIVLAGSNVGEMYRLEGEETVLGRGNNATIRLNDDGISRRHARLFKLGTEVLIEDLQSSNGTTVNGDTITRRTLQDGDKIRLGSTTVLKFTYNQLDEKFQQQMYDAALRDALTKAFNRKYFLDRLETELAYSRRHSEHLSLLMFDLDHFKRVNDTYGHVAGDYVLARFAKITASTLRAEDVFARYGGEEFALLCRGVPLGNGGLLGERIRSLVEAKPFEHESARIRVTTSVGVAAYPEIQAEAGLQLIGAADEALYEAKRTGRNRVLLKYGSR